MQHHDSTSTTVREEVITAVALYAHKHEIRRLREVTPGAYVPRHRHDTDGHLDERVFLAAIAAHPRIARIERATHAEDEALGLDALVTVRDEAVPVPIDVTTRGRTNREYTANLLDTLRRGVVPVVIERVPTDLTPDVAYAAFEFWWRKSEEYFRAWKSLLAIGGITDTTGR